MFCIKFVWQLAIPNSKLPFINKVEKVSYQLLYFCQIMKLRILPKILLLASILITSMSTVSHAQEKWTFEQCVQYALEHNLTLKQSVLDKRMAELTLKQSRLSQIPTLNASIGGTFNNGRNINPNTNVAESVSFFSTSPNLGASIELFNWFRVRNTIAANRYEAEATYKLLEKAKNDIAFNIANAFLQIILANETIKVNQSQVKQTQAQLDNTKKLVAAGSVSEANQADIEAQLARDSSSLVTSKNNYIIAVLQMKAILNFDFETPFDVQLPADIKNVPLLSLDQVAPEMVFSSALANQPQTEVDKLRIKSAQKTLKAARATLLPSLFLSANLNTAYNNQTTHRVFTGTSSKLPIGLVDINNQTYQTYTITEDSYQDKTSIGTQFDNNFGQNIGASIRIPILNGWQARGQVENAKLQLENRKLTYDINTQQLRQDVYTAYANAEAALDKYKSALRIEESSAKAYDFATKRFDVGLLSSIEYITAQTNLFQAQTDRLYALYDYIFKVKLLEFYRDQKITL